MLFLFFRPNHCVHGELGLRSSERTSLTAYPIGLHTTKCFTWRLMRGPVYVGMAHVLQSKSRDEQLESSASQKDKNGMLPRKPWEAVTAKYVQPPSNERQLNPSSNEQLRSAAELKKKSGAVQERSHDEKLDVALMKERRKLDSSACEIFSSQRGHGLNGVSNFFLVASGLGGWDVQGPK